MAKTEEMFFVEVREPTLVRRAILETLRDILESLKRFEKFKAVRQKKLSLVNKLQKDMRDINRQMGALRGRFPEAQVKMMLKPAEKNAPSPAPLPKQAKKKQIQRKLQETTSAKPVSEVDKLASELAAIEEKLRTLQ